MASDFVVLHQLQSNTIDATAARDQTRIVAQSIFKAGKSATTMVVDFSLPSKLLLRLSLVSCLVASAPLSSETFGGNGR